MASARFVIGAVASGLVHVGAFFGMQHAHAGVKPAAPSVVIEVDTTAPPPPRPAPPAPEKESPEPAAAPIAKHVAKANSAPAPAAQAGKTLTADDDSNAVADFTMVQGNGTYAGGVTASNGTARAPVSETRGGAPAKTGSGGSGDAPTGSDKSARATQLGSDWACPFPSGATRDLAFVTVVVRVKSDGRAETASVVADPGEGFGAAARACAMRQRYEAAKDRDGRAIAGTTSPFRIRFTR